MPTIVHKLGEKDPEDWKRLQEMNEGGFLYGECYAFAIALHQGLGWPIVGLYVESHADHAGVRSPDGIIFDIRGSLSEEEFGALYAKPPYDIREISEEKLRVGWTCPRYTAEYSIQRARRIAEVLWPELPWKETRITKIIAFADELEALCRKHKFWIRATVPASPPPLATEEGAEGGYRLRPTIDGITYTIDRYLVP